MPHKGREHSRTAECWCTPLERPKGKPKNLTEAWDAHTFTNAVSNVYVCDCGEYSGNLQGYEAHLKVVTKGLS